MLQINPTNIYFRGVGGTERKEHEVTIELYKEIVPEVRIQIAIHPAFPLLIF